MNHVSIGLGSSGELQTCVELAQRLAVVTPQRAAALTEASDEISRMLYGRYNELQAKIDTEEARRAKEQRTDLCSPPSTADLQP